MGPSVSSPNRFFVKVNLHCKSVCIWGNVRPLAVIPEPLQPGTIDRDCHCGTHKILPGYVWSQAMSGNAFQSLTTALASRIKYM